VAGRHDILHLSAIQAWQAPATGYLTLTGSYHIPRKFLLPGLGAMRSRARDPGEKPCLVNSE
jgi:hypothetical protein